MVFAHVIVGNTYPYTVQDWETDINLAHAYGIDAFALNVGADTWGPARVADAYSAAEATGTGFKLFISLDMSSLPCTSAADATSLQPYVTNYTSHPNQLKYDNKVFLSTFAGETCLFGQATTAQGWTTFLSPLTGTNAVFFVPSFFSDPTTWSSTGVLNVMDGGFSWNSAWPVDATASNYQTLAASDTSQSTSLIISANQFQGTQNSLLVENILTSTGPDATYVSALQGKPYMAGVSPWFFTHYSPQTYNKSFVYLADSLYASRWNTLIQYRNSIPFVEVITWNDYGESHYIGPIKGSQPNSQAWVDGYDHQAWLHMTKYFTTAYKTGAYPALTSDVVYVWARPHPKDATAPDSIGKPTNYEMLEDAMFAVVLATSGATLQLNLHSFTVPAGFSHYSIPLSAGDKMQASLFRNGAPVVQVDSGNYTFNPNPPSYNYNAFVTFGCSGSC
ncbi:glycoside hydrolase [Schizopora paradoxa]|uniref:Glycoside hydrolase n=1 Tax=Schizopora paradoxa TaxID=27342 RepID=A0A0H2SCB6_9AGAM|nr:glycoside hydrolase [Schizopora paradoxa]